MTEKPEGNQAESFIAGLQKTINNTSLRKHRVSIHNGMKLEFKKALERSAPGVSKLDHLNIENDNGVNNCKL